MIDYALHGILPNDPRKAVSVRQKSTRFYYEAVVKTLYRCSYDGILLCCLSNSEAQEVIKEAMMVYVELINQDQSSRIDCTDLAIIGRL